MPDEPSYDAVAGLEGDPQDLGQDGQPPSNPFDRRRCQRLHAQLDQLSAIGLPVHLEPARGEAGSRQRAECGWQNVLGAGRRDQEIGVVGAVAGTLPRARERPLVDCLSLTRGQAVRWISPSQLAKRRWP